MQHIGDMASLQCSCCQLGPPPFSKLLLNYLRCERTTITTATYVEYNHLWPCMLTKRHVHTPPDNPSPWDTVTGLATSSIQQDIQSSWPER